jgi:hypothetical protein
MSEKKKTLDFLTKQIALQSILIDKTELLLEDLKKQRKKDMLTYEQTTKASEKSMEEMINGSKRHD